MVDISILIHCTRLKFDHDDDEDDDHDDGYHHYRHHDIIIIVIMTLLITIFKSPLEVRQIDIKWRAFSLPSPLFVYRRLCNTEIRYVISFYSNDQHRCDLSPKLDPASVL